MPFFDGGPAFPRAAFAPDGVTCEDFQISDPEDGMSLRDWFAGNALPAIIRSADEAFLWANEKGGAKVPSIESYAVDAYRIADAMLVERRKAAEKAS